MATIAAVNQVGESVVKLLNDRRSLLAAAGQLGDLPPSAEIAHISMTRLAHDPEPTGGLTFMLYRIEPSEFQWRERQSREPERPSTLGVDLLFMLTAWSATSKEEQAMMSWAMLELYKHALLDRSLLVGDAVWEREEAVQLVHERVSDDTLFRLWETLQRRYRLSTSYRARVIRLTQGGDSSYPVVVGRRLGFAPADPLTEGAS